MLGLQSTISLSQVRTSLLLAPVDPYPVSTTLPLDGGVRRPSGPIPLLARPVKCAAIGLKLFGRIPPTSAVESPAAPVSSEDFSMDSTLFVTTDRPETTLAVPRSRWTVQRLPLKLLSSSPQPPTQPLTPPIRSDSYLSWLRPSSARSDSKITAKGSQSTGECGASRNSHTSNKARPSFFGGRIAPFKLSLKPAYPTTSLIETSLYLFWSLRARFPSYWSFGTRFTDFHCPWLRAAVRACLRFLALPSPLPWAPRR